MQRIIESNQRSAGYTSVLATPWALLLLLLIAACCPAKASAAISYVQGTDSVTQNTATLSATYSAAQVAGDMNIIVIGWDSSTITLKSAPTDTKGNVYKLAVNVVDSKGNTQAIYYAANIAAAAANSNTVSITLSASSAYPDLRITEYSGVNTLDKAIGSDGDATTATSTAVTTTQPNELIFGSLYNWGTTTAAGSGFTERILDSDASLVEDKTVTSTGSYAATATVSGGTSGEWLMEVATFYSAGGSAPAAPTGLGATATSSTNINLTWTASTGATSYDVLRASASAGPYSQIGTSTSASYSDSTVSASTTYFYEVEAVNTYGTSSPSGDASATTPASTGGTAYYVNAKTGSKTNPGTAAAPFLTIAQATAVATTPGTTVYVAAGTYPEIVDISASGTASAPITFQGASGAIIDGTTLSCCATQTYLNSGSVAIGQLQNTEGLVNIMSTTGSINYITFEGFTIQNFTTPTLTDVPAGIFVAGGGNGIVINGNTISNISNLEAPANGNNPNSYPVGIFGTTTTGLSVTFSNNIVTNNQTGQSETVAFNGNVQNFAIYNNQIYGNDNIGLDVEGFYNMGPTGYDQPYNGRVYSNTVYHNSAINNPGEGGDGYDADGIYCDGCKETVIEQNTVYANDYGIEAASEIPGGLASNVIIRSNLVYGNNAVGISVGGYTQAACTGDCGGGSSQNIYILNNTLYDNQQSTGEPNASNNGELQAQYRATGIVMENNIVDAPSGWFINNLDATNNTVTFGYNDYYTTSSSIYFQTYTVKTSGSGSKTKYTNTAVPYDTVASFDSSVGDTTSTTSNPDFITIPSCTFSYTPIGGDSTLSSAGTCTGTTNFDIPTTSPDENTGTLALGTPSGTAWDAYQLDSPFVGPYDINNNPRTASNKINLGAYEQ